MNSLILSFLDFINWIVSFLPTASSSMLSTISDNPVNSLFQAMQPATVFVDINFFITVFGFILGVESVIFGYRLIVWIIQMVSVGFVKLQ